MANESMMMQIAKVNSNIVGIFGRKRNALIALSIRYAAKALQQFRVRQRGEEWWDNQTYTAVNTVFSSSMITADVVGFFLSHLVEYGVYLELANNRKHEALRPVVFELEKQFMEDVKRIIAA
jgi:hypothetical protein